MRRTRLLLVAIGLLTLSESAWSHAGPRLQDVLARAGQRVLRYEAQLPFLVARETSVQRAWAAPGATVDVPERRLVAEIGWIASGRAGDLICVRDVIEVDGRPLPETDRSALQRLLHGAAAPSLQGATDLLLEAARYNLAEGSRNFNLPTVALFFLHPHTERRFKWNRTSDSSAPVWTIDFKERERPTIIRTGDGEPVFSRGTVEVDVATGEIRRTELRLLIDKLTYRLTTRFGDVPEMGMVLPVRLNEWYATRGGIVTGEATYDLYRRFQTSARIVQ
jgi:hypothetical protein